MNMNIQDANALEKATEIFEQKLKDSLGLKALFLYLRKDALVIDMIEVDKAERHNGKGTKAMEEIVAFADKNRLSVELTAGQKDARHGTTSRSRLLNFYKRFGFVENKGRNLDFTISKGMYRPKAKPDFTAQHAAMKAKKKTLTP